jgi:gluconate 2-dehydrogenase gamma chain
MQSVEGLIMTSKADWKVIPGPVDPDTDQRLFFTEHEWNTVEAAAARIIPSDRDPGAREARVIVFIDRYLSGINYVFSAADGSGFLEMTGMHAVAWRARMADMQRTYRNGIRELDALSTKHLGKRFVDLSEQDQDRALEILSGRPKPGPVTLGKTEAVSTFLQGVFDEGLPFWEALCLHVRQGFYCDPVYGGNKDRIGWKVIGFPGPARLRDTMDGTYSTAEFFEQSYSWAHLIPYLNQQTHYEVPAPVKRRS